MKLKTVYFALAIIFCVSMASAQVTGKGTKGAIAIWTGSSSIGNSPIASVGGNIGIGTIKPDGKLDVENNSTTLSAVFAQNAATSGSVNGVFGITNSPAGNGVLGVNNSATGYAPGVTGISNNSGSPGVNGFSNATTGGLGVVGAAATSGTAIMGINQSCSGGVCSPVAGTGGLFITGSGGTVLLGQVNNGVSSVNVFRVDDTGKGYFDGGTQTGGADFAESVALAKGQDYQEPGDLLIVDSSSRRQLKLATEPYSTLVAGIYSTKPGVLATSHKMTERTANEIPVAIVGIVPCKVSAENGAIQPGDLLVTSSTPGHAMKGTDRSKMLGAVVGKALEPLTEGKGVIQVLVTLQ